MRKYRTFPTGSPRASPPDCPPCRTVPADMRSRRRAPATPERPASAHRMRFPASARTRFPESSQTCRGPARSRLRHSAPCPGSGPRKFRRTSASGRNRDAPGGRTPVSAASTPSLWPCRYSRRRSASPQLHTPRRSPPPGRKSRTPSAPRQAAPETIQYPRAAPLRRTSRRPSPLCAVPQYRAAAGANRRRTQIHRSAPASARQESDRRTASPSGTGVPPDRRRSAPHSACKRRKRQGAATPGAFPAPVQGRSSPPPLPAVRRARRQATTSGLPTAGGNADCADATSALPPHPPSIHESANRSRSAVPGRPERCCRARRRPPARFRTFPPPLRNRRSRPGTSPAWSVCRPLSPRRPNVPPPAGRHRPEIRFHAISRPPSATPRGTGTLRRRHQPAAD